MQSKAEHEGAADAVGPLTCMKEKLSKKKKNYSFGIAYVKFISLPLFAERLPKGKKEMIVFCIYYNDNIE